MMQLARAAIVHLEQTCTLQVLRLRAYVEYISLPYMEYCLLCIGASSGRCLELEKCEEHVLTGQVIIAIL